MCIYNGPDSSVVRGYGLGAGGPEFDPHHVKLSGLQVRPLKVSGGSPVHLRSKNRATGSRTWKEDVLGQQTKTEKCICICVYICICGCADIWKASDIRGKNSRR